MNAHALAPCWALDWCLWGWWFVDTQSSDHRHIWYANLWIHWRSSQIPWFLVAAHCPWQDSHALLKSFVPPAAFLVWFWIPRHSWWSKRVFPVASWCWMLLGSFSDLASSYGERRWILPATAIVSMCAPQHASIQDCLPTCPSQRRVAANQILASLYNTYRHLLTYLILSLTKYCRDKVSITYIRVAWMVHLLCSYTACLVDLLQSEWGRCLSKLDD